MSVIWPAGNGKKFGTQVQKQLSGFTAVLWSRFYTSVNTVKVKVIIDQCGVMSKCNRKDSECKRKLISNLYDKKVKYTSDRDLFKSNEQQHQMQKKLIVYFIFLDRHEIHSQNWYSSWGRRFYFKVAAEKFPSWDTIKGGHSFRMRLSTVTGENFEFPTMGKTKRLYFSCV